MISPDILEHSGSAGLLGYVVIGVICLALPTLPDEDGSSKVTYGDSISSERAWEPERRPDPRHPHLERPSDHARASRAETTSRSNADLEARSRRARRTMQVLRQLQTMRADGASHQDVDRLLRVLNDRYESAGLPIRFERHSRRGPVVTWNLNETSLEDGSSKRRGTHQQAPEPSQPSTDSDETPRRYDCRLPLTF